MEPVGVKFRVNDGSGLGWQGNCIEAECVRGRLRWTWDRIPNDLLSVSRRINPRAPNAVCVRERSRQAEVKQAHLIFGSASADHQDTTRSLQPAVTISSISIAARSPFSFA